VILSLAWGVELLALPAYFNNLARARHSMNNYQTVIMGALNLFFSIYLGIRFGTSGVVVGYALSIVISTIFFLKMFEKENNFLENYFDEKTWKYLFFSAILVITLAILYESSKPNSLAVCFLYPFLALLLLLGWGYYYHPVIRDAIVAIETTNE
jgi:O-antigen/teichoic acid export membrane protein